MKAGGAALEDAEGAGPSRGKQPLRLLILGIGNVLFGDDSLGVIAVQMLAQRYAPGPGVSLRDGGTFGLSLLPLFEDTKQAILVDAVHSESPPGSLVRIEAPEAAAGACGQFPHGAGLADLLEGVRRLDRRPGRIVLLGLVPGTLDAQLGCSPDVEAALPDLVRAVADEAARLGSPLRPRAGPPADLGPSARWAARMLGLESADVRADLAGEPPRRP
jgi:hydrogenase maturation protease